MSRPKGEIPPHGTVQRYRHRTNPCHDDCCRVPWNAYIKELRDSKPKVAKPRKVRERPEIVKEGRWLITVWKHPQGFAFTHPLTGEVHTKPTKRQLYGNIHSSLRYRVISITIRYTGEHLPNIRMG